MTLPGYSMTVLSETGEPLITIKLGTPPPEIKTVERLREWFAAEEARMLGELQAWCDGVVVAMQERASDDPVH